MQSFKNQMKDAGLTKQDKRALEEREQRKMEKLAAKERERELKELFGKAPEKPGTFVLSLSVSRTQTVINIELTFLFCILFRPLQPPQQLLHQRKIQRSWIATKNLRRRTCSMLWPHWQR